MADINLVTTPDLVEKHNVASWRWTGAQAWIGNSLYATVPTGGRPVRAVQVRLQARNITIPSTATAFALIQAYVNGNWFNFARITPLQEASVTAYGATLTWLRNTIGVTMISATGTLLIYTPHYDNAPNTAGLPIFAESIRLWMMGNALVGTDVVVGTPGTNVQNSNPLVVVSTAHGLTTGDLIRITACAGSASWVALLNTVHAVTVVDVDTLVIADVNSTAYGTCTSFTWAADVSMTKIGLDVMFE